MDEQALRARVRELIDTERLVWPEGRRVVSGTGPAVPCDICDEPIDPGDTRLTFQNGRTLHIHRHCFRVWVEELER